ncbi:caspase-6-like [Ostrea edulis]|uniref:caspase-6-like n=1 Tax=Ostrea edulis TaxID=37623 RepID=UPI0020954CDA|nr:caspase-6-like [Ostrea edulis]XP_048770139.1 caspase-6-like [Ostrea edulis]
MDERQRGILRKSRSIFTRDLVDVDTVCDRLYQKEVLSEGMKNEILSENTRENKVRKLMDIIPKRGKRAFRAFFDVLEETFQHNLSDILCPGGQMDDLETKYNALHGFQSKRATDKPLLQRSMSAEVRREPVESISEFQEQHKTCEFPLECKDFQKLAIVEEDFVLPSNWPSEQEHAQSLNFKICKSRSSPASLREEWSRMYPMTRRPLGRLVIINNFQFDGEVDDERMKRSQQDTTSLDVLFKQLHFQTKQHSNLTLEGLSSLLEEERTRDHTSIDCYVMVFMSRGDGERIYGIDGYRIDIDTIISTFDFEHCSSLRRKPKIFIFQACDDVAAKSKLLGAEKKNYEILTSSTTSEHMRTDMFVVNAVQDVAVSYHGIFGSRFIQSFVYLMRNLAFNEDFEEIVRKINHLNSVSEPEIIKFASSFSRRLFFNP